MHEPKELSTAACEELLATQVVGRIAFNTPRGPQLFPLNYGIVDGTLVIRTSPYSVLAQHSLDAQVVFEIDEFDHEYQHGWSVAVHGRLSQITEAAEIDRVRSVWEPRPWAGGASRNLYLRLAWTELTGRRLGTGWDILGTLTTRRRVGTPAPASTT